MYAINTFTAIKCQCPLAPLRRSLTAVLDQVINFHRASLALNKLKRKRQVSKTSAKHGQNKPDTVTPPESTAISEPEPDPSETMELEVLRRLGKEYLRLLKGPATTDTELMEPLDCVKLLYAFTEVDFHPGEGAKGLMVSVNPMPAMQDISC